MFARLRSSIFPPSAPSALLVIGNVGATIQVLHLIPKDGDIERFGLTTQCATFSHGGATETAREQIGRVTLNVGDGETPGSFLDNVERRARKIGMNSLSSGPEHLQKSSTRIIDIVQNILQPAALGAIYEREVQQDRSVNATQTYPVFIIRIQRSRVGKIITEPTSIS